MAHRGYDETLLAPGRVVGGYMESTYFGQSLILMPIAGTSRLPYQPNGLAVFLTRNISCFYEFSHSGGQQVFFECHAHNCTHFPAQGVCRYGHGECNNRYMLAAPPMLLASLPSLRGGRSYRRASGHSRCPVTTSYPPFPAQGV